jgi:hypothetical protein
MPWLDKTRVSAPVMIWGLSGLWETKPCLIRHRKLAVCKLLLVMTFQSRRAGELENTRGLLSRSSQVRVGQGA